MIFEASLKGELWELKKALEEGQDPNSLTGKGETPLLLSLRQGNLEEARYLIENGANPNLEDDKGETPLLVALKKGNFALVDLLLNKGANPNLGVFDAGEEFSDHGNRPLHYAVHSRRSDIVKLLLENGAVVDIGNHQGDTPLHKASSILGGTKGVIKTLLKNGANPNAKNNEGRTPFHKVTSSNRPNMIKFFFRYGAKANLKDNKGNAPFHIMAEDMFQTVAFEILSVLESELGFKEGWEKRTEDFEKAKTIIIKASRSYRSNIVESVIALMGEGADIDLKNQEGMTALDVLHRNFEGILNDDGRIEEEVKKVSKERSQVEVLIFLEWIKCGRKFERVLKEHGAKRAKESN